MPEHKNKYGWRIAVLFAVLITLAGLNLRELTSGDETRVAGIAAEMFTGGDWLLPRLNGNPFLEYPPLYYWTVAAAYAALGVCDFAALLPAALAAVGCGLLIFGWARRLEFPVWGALAAEVLLMTGAQFFEYSRKCMVDMELAFFILLAVSSFHGALTARTRTAAATGWLFFALGAAGGIYTKGALGVGIPVAVLGVYLVGADVMDRKFSWKSYLTLGAGTLAALGLAAIWYFLIYRSGGMKMLDTALITNNLGRFSGSQGDHVKPVYFYLLRLPTLFFPWLPLLAVSLWYAVKQLKTGRDRKLALLLLSFIIVPFIALSLASGKRTVYLLPLYAPCAMLCAWFLVNPPPFWRRLADRLRRRLPEKWRSFDAGRAALALGVLALLYAGIDVGRSLYSNPRESLRPLFQRCAELERSGGRVVLMNPAERTSGAANFYLRHTLPVIPLTHATPPPGEYRIVRAKNFDIDGERFADHHRLISNRNGVILPEK